MLMTSAIPERSHRLPRCIPWAPALSLLLIMLSGLRYHGMSPILSKLYHDGYMEAVSVEQTRVFEAAVEFAKKETILPAPESAHAIRAAMDEALRCKETGEKKDHPFRPDWYRLFRYDRLLRLFGGTYDGLYSYRRGSAKRLQRPAENPGNPGISLKKDNCSCGFRPLAGSETAGQSRPLKRKFPFQGAAFINAVRLI